MLKDKRIPKPTIEHMRNTLKQWAEEAKQKELLIHASGQGKTVEQMREKELQEVLFID